MSGSLEAFWFYRVNHDLLDGNDASMVPIGTTVPAQDHTSSATDSSEADDFFSSIARIRIDADLTEGVAAVVSLVNQRDWNANDFQAGGSNAQEEWDLNLHLAYVEISNFFELPVTVTVGRQEILLGRGFMIGGNYLGTTGIQASEYTALTGFDAVRFTGNWDDWTLDGIFVQVDENAPNPDDDRELWIAYLTRKFSEEGSAAELYSVTDLDRGNLQSADGTDLQSIYTFGGRVNVVQEPWTVGAEALHQSGDYFDSMGSPKRQRDAWAVDVVGEYRWADSLWKPRLGAEVVYQSGEKDLSAEADSDYHAGSYNFRYLAYGLIHDDLESYYATAEANDPTYGHNQSIWNVSIGLTPQEDMALTLAYFYFRAVEDVHVDASDPNSDLLSRDIGHEVDLIVSVSLTENLLWTFSAGCFWPGELYQPPNDATAVEFVNSLKVDW